MIESGGRRAAFESDPLQVNVRGDFTPDKAQATGLKLGQAIFDVVDFVAVRAQTIDKDQQATEGEM